MNQRGEVILLQGVSGAGKSTLASKLIDASTVIHALGDRQAVVVSADLYFRQGDPSKYEFDFTKLGDAHAWCFREFIGLITKGYDTVTAPAPACPAAIIVDNTNTTVADCAPYVQAARSFGYRPRIIRIVTDWQLAAARNEGRAPANIVEVQSKNLEFQRFPAHWPTQLVKAEDIAEATYGSRIIHDILLGDP